jgi:hypothetical protein
VLLVCFDFIAGGSLLNTQRKTKRRGQGIVFVLNATKRTVNVALKATAVCHFYNGLAPGQTVYMRTGAACLTLEVKEAKQDKSTDYTVGQVVFYNVLGALGLAALAAGVGFAVAADVVTAGGSGTTAAAIVSWKAIGPIVSPIPPAITAGPALDVAAKVLCTFGSAAISVAAPEMVSAPVHSHFVHTRNSPRFVVEEVENNGFSQFRLTKDDERVDLGGEKLL